MAAWLSLLNRLLPFATPGTPILQDLVHLAAICCLLYFGPQIQERIQRAPPTTNDGDQPQAHDHLEDEELDLHDAADAVAQDPDEIQENEHGEDDLDGDEDDAELNLRQANDAPAAGPANGRAIMPEQRNVGAKKAKALARRDQRRAYNEFMRVQGDTQRAKDAEGAAEREAAQAAEKERRRAATAKLEEKKAKEREQRREQERKERQEEQARRDLAVRIVRRELDERRMCNLSEVARQIGGDADDVWLQKILSAGGVLGRSADGALTLVSQMGWVITVRESDMAQLYKTVAEVAEDSGDSGVSYEKACDLLESVLKNQ